MPPPAYPPPPPPTGYPAAHPGYPPSGYGHRGAVAWKPGVIPLRPLSLTDVFNGAVEYIRANPKPTLGLTTVIVLITTVGGFALGQLMSTTDGTVQAIATAAAGGIAALLGTTLLAGMLTVIVARSVLGARITIAQAWQRIRGRLPALLGLTLLEVAAAAALIGAVVLTIAGVADAAGGMIATLIGIPLVMLALGVFAWAATSLSMAPVATVLEHLGVVAAIRRSRALVRPRFWRTLGILLLAGVAAGLIAGAVSVPFDLAGNVLSFGSRVRTPTLGGSMVATIGQAIGQILITPFMAGVIVLLYVDARIRSEALDLRLLGAPAGSADADSLWLNR